MLSFRLAGANVKEEEQARCQSGVLNVLRDLATVGRCLRQTPCPQSEQVESDKRTLAGMPGQFELTGAQEPHWYRSKRSEML
jgi:hypothetical protein